jgi:inhibitor of KinA
MPEFRIAAAGDSALVVELPARIDPAISSRAVALSQAIGTRFAGQLRDVVVGYCSVTVYFDPLETDADRLGGEILMLAERTAGTVAEPGRTIQVPVCYGGELGPDLGAVCNYASLPATAVIALHTAVTYRVYMSGFVPGFAYMASVDPRIALPRRPTPRDSVPRGSVAIAAGQTGIYPLDTPGGWHIIGRTHVAPYDPSRAEPFLFHPGDQVTFRSIDRAEFDAVAS